MTSFHQYSQTSTDPEVSYYSQGKPLNQQKAGCIIRYMGWLQLRGFYDSNFFHDSVRNGLFHIEALVDMPCHLSG